MELLPLMLGGAAGAVLRFSFERGLAAVRGGALGVWPSFSVNFLGCFALGLLLGSAIVHDLQVGYHVLVGGTITTFSVFSLQLMELMHRRLYGLAGLRAFTGWIVGAGAATIGVVVSLT